MLKKLTIFAGNFDKKTGHRSRLFVPDTVKKGYSPAATLFLFFTLF